jgi:SAM-dependent methyltransferase
MVNTVCTTAGKLLPTCCAIIAANGPARIERPFFEMLPDSQSYEHTRQAWRDIWTETDFDRELKTLAYRRTQRLMDIYLPYLDRTAPLLEAGCGMGQIVYYLRQRGYQAIGIDYAPEAVQATRRRFPDLPLYVGDVHCLPFPSHSLSGYLSFGVVEHFEQGPADALAEAFRVLRPGGVLILTVPHPNFVEGMRSVVNRLFPARLERLGPRAEYYERTFHHDELFQHVTAAGFQTERLVPYSHSYTFYGLGGVFRGNGYYETSQLAELAGDIGRILLPWTTAFASLIVASKPE